VKVEEVIDASIDDMHTRSNICHYFVNVDEDDSNTRKTTHVDEELEDCREETCPIHESVERSNNAKNFTLPLIQAPTIRRQSTSTPIIDYSKPWIVIYDECLAELKQMAKLKDEAEAERVVRKEEMERCNLNMQVYTKLKKTKRKNKECWIGKQRRNLMRPCLVKRCKEV
jgi:hypothetical protein